MEALNAKKRDVGDDEKLIYFSFCTGTWTRLFVFIDIDDMCQRYGSIYALLHGRARKRKLL